MLKDIIHPIHRDGWKFIAIAAAVTLLLFIVWQPLGWLGVLITAWCAYFFRDPARVTPLRPGLIVSPADGLVVAVRPAPPPRELEMGDEPMMRVSIFLNLLDVHINRVPAEGIVQDTHYRKGKFLNAALDKASIDNERMAIRLKTVEGPEIVIVQIAGWVARRIVCRLLPGMPVQAGERLGLIRFGSRSDLYVPREWAILVIEGQRVYGGETVIADATSREPTRLGMRR